MRVPRGSVATLPPIISGPIYWGPDDWYFYPWGYGALALGYFWDPWMWTGYYGGMGGYPWVDPYWSGGGGAAAATAAGTTPTARPAMTPAASRAGSGATRWTRTARPAALRLKVEPRDAEVYVDGFYAGLVDDFDGAMQKLKIVPGLASRRVACARATRRLTFTVNVIAGETTSYKTELKRH